jgi:hypothetical protein
MVAAAHPDLLGADMTILAKPVTQRLWGTRLRAVT